MKIKNCNIFVSDTPIEIEEGDEIFGNYISGGPAHFLFTRKLMGKGKDPLWLKIWYFFQKKEDVIVADAMIEIPAPEDK